MDALNKEQINDLQRITKITLFIISMSGKNNIFLHTEDW